MNYVGEAMNEQWTVPAKSPAAPPRAINGPFSEIWLAHCVPEEE